MRILIDLPPSAAKKAAALLEHGHFASMEDLLAVAIARLPDAIRPTELLGAQPNDSISPRRTGVRPEGVGASDQTTEAPWIWGMTNRVFPLKLVTRVCADLATENATLLEDLHVAASERALHIATVLQADDELHARKRNDARSVALPSSRKSDKSKVRFAQHFVGRRGADGRFQGGAFETGLLGPIGDGLRIAPTRLGWDFAAIANPVLDENQVGSANLSEAERGFYLATLAPAVPAELHAFTTILLPVCDWMYRVIDLTASLANPSGER